MMFNIMSICSIYGAIMLGDSLISTVNQKILQFLSKYSDMEFHEREIARRTGISYGSANRASNELFTSGVLRRRQAGKMLFYAIDSSNPAIIEFKKLVNILLLEPLVNKLKNVSSRIVLFGSCAQGTDNSKSDMDIFIVAGSRDNVNRIIEVFHFPMGYEEICIQAIIKTPVAMLDAGESTRVFLSEVEKGIVLWDSDAHES
jgi:predicted nucleotidyltransferase